MPSRTDIRLWDTWNIKLSYCHNCEECSSFREEYLALVMKVKVKVGSYYFQCGRMSSECRLSTVLQHLNPSSLTKSSVHSKVSTSMHRFPLSRVPVAWLRRSGGGGGGGVVLLLLKDRLSDSRSRSSGDLITWHKFLGDRPRDLPAFPTKNPIF